jgi:hypothetical protein
VRTIRTHVKRACKLGWLGVGLAHFNGKHNRLHLYSAAVPDDLELPSADEAITEAAAGELGVIEGDAASELPHHGRDTANPSTEMRQESAPDAANPSTEMRKQLVTTKSLREVVKKGSERSAAPVGREARANDLDGDNPMRSFLRQLVDEHGHHIDSVRAVMGLLGRYDDLTIAHNTGWSIDDVAELRRVRDLTQRRGSA